MGVASPLGSQHQGWFEGWRGQGRGGKLASRSQQREGLGGRDIICSINSLPVGFRERKNIPLSPQSGWFTDCTAFIPNEMQRLLAKFGWAGSGY